VGRVIGGRLHDSVNMFLFISVTSLILYRHDGTFFYSFYVWH